MMAPRIRTLVIVTLLSVVEVCRGREQVFLDRLHEVLQASDTRISSLCRHHTAVYLNQLRLGAPWALKMLDSSAKIPSGVLEGGLTFMGVYSECLEALPEGVTLLNVSATEKFHSRYCRATLDIHNAQEETPKGFPEYLWQELRRNLDSPEFGLCVPSSCSSEDITTMVGEFAKGFVDGVNATKTTCSSPQKPLMENTGALVVSGVLLLFVLLVVLGTAYDVIISRKEDHKTSASLKSLDIKLASSEGLVDDDDSKGNKLGRILLCFSLLANGAKILSTGTSSKDTISVIHGLRFYSMNWIISGHSFSTAVHTMAFTNTFTSRVIPEDPFSQAVANGTLVVDTFFFISGLLVVYISLNVMSKTGGKLNLWIFYSHRYWRMTPLMMAVVGICATLLPYFGEGPRWDQSISGYVNNCQANWWTNAIYLQNFIGAEHMCLSQTWFSAMDIQMYLISPLIVFALYRNPRWGLALLGVIFVASVAVTAALTAINDYPAIPYIPELISEQKRAMFMLNVYIKPYCRIGPCLVGMLTGYIIHVTKGSIVLRKAYVWLGWTICSVLMLGVLYAMWPANAGKGLPSVGWAATYAALGRSVWAVGLSWIVLASLAGYGGIVTRLLSWKALVPLSRLTYSAYIVHPIVITMFYGSRQEVFYYSEYLIAYFAAANVSFTYGAAFLLSMVFEAPVLALEKLLLGRV